MLWIIVNKKNADDFGFSFNHTLLSTISYLLLVIILLYNAIYSQRHNDGVSWESSSQKYEYRNNFTVRCNFDWNRNSSKTIESAPYKRWLIFIKCSDVLFLIDATGTRFIFQWMYFFGKLHEWFINNFISTVQAHMYSIYFKVAPKTIKQFWV